jgi:putative Flp pilus-assembly TadE/G-like protein
MHSNVTLARLRGDAGSMIVAAAITLGAFALLGSGLLEVGKWYQQRRGLQVRTDNAALAAGDALNACFNIPSQFANEAAADTYIENWAKNYGGFSSVVSTQSGAPYNGQAGTGTSYMSFQSDSFPSAATPQPAKNLNNECFVDGNPANTAPSNVNLMADVKMTQAGIAPWFSFSPFADIHGWARVQLQAVKSLKPTLPLAVPDVNPRMVAVTFVDNTTGQALPAASCAQATGQTNYLGGCVFDLPTKSVSASLNDWTGQATITPPSADTNIGVRVSIGATEGTCAGVNTVSGATTSYTCYDYSNTGQPSPRGVIDLRSYSTAAVAGTPILRSVTPGSCSGTPYFSQYQATTGTCTVGVSAVVDFPSGATNPKVTYAIVQGNCNNPNGQMTQSGTTWTSTATTTLNVGTGAYDICMDWSYTNSSGATQKGSFANGSVVQQIFAGSDGSDPTVPGGPIMAAMVDTGMTPGYSLPTGSATTVAVTIGVTGGVHVNPRCPADTPPGNTGGSYVCLSDPQILLRTKSATSNSSLTYTIDCGTVPGHTGGTTYQQFRYGCANSFSFNTADICPDPVPQNPTSCAPVQTGVQTGQVRQALNDLLAPNGVCAADNYPNTTIDGDPRIVLLVDTDFSSFTGSGNGTVPVVTFATFYITGWAGADPSCTTGSNPINQPPPTVAGGSADGNIWGHFINYSTGGGVPSGLKCNLGSFAPCIPALVR